MQSPAGISEVTELSSNWQPVLERLNDWTGQLRTRANDLEQDRAALARLRQEWELTLEGADANELPPAVRKRLEATLRSIRAT